jgi:hypothetical protein
MHLSCPRALPGWINHHLKYFVGAGGGGGVGMADGDGIAGHDLIPVVEVNPPIAETDEDTGLNLLLG